MLCQPQIRHAGAAPTGVGGVEQYRVQGQRGSSNSSRRRPGTQCQGSAAVAWEAARETALSRPLWAEDWDMLEAHELLCDKFVQAYEATIEVKDHSESTS